MANIYENLEIIATAVYGKEMRPAIKEALIQSMDLVNRVSTEASALEERIAALENSGGGGGDVPDDPGGGGSTPTAAGCNVSGAAYTSIDALVSSYAAVGEAIAV